MAKREVVITNTDEYGKDEWYTLWYQCPHCHNTDIARGFSYCPHCGYKLVWEVPDETET